MEKGDSICSFIGPGSTPALKDLPMKRLSLDLLQRAIDYFFPALCIVCDKPRPKTDQWICVACAEALRENHERRNPCPHCAMNRILGPCRCGHGPKFPFASINAVFDYDDTVGALLHHAKYRGKKSLAFDLGGRMANLLPPALFDGLDALVPLPLHPSRLRQRGYNQALCLARGIAAVHDLPILEKSLQRIRKTPPQINLDKKRRLKNMAHAFAMVKSWADAIRGKRLLLIDDVVTTGASTTAAAHTLLDAGAASVSVLSLARD